LTEKRRGRQTKKDLTDRPPQYCSLSFRACLRAREKSPTVAGQRRPLTGFQFHPRSAGTVKQAADYRLLVKAAQMVISFGLYDEMPGILERLSDNFGLCHQPSVGIVGVAVDDLRF